MCNPLLMLSYHDKYHTQSNNPISVLVLSFLGSGFPEEIDVNICYFTGSSSSLKRYLKKTLHQHIQYNYYLINTLLLLRYWEEL